jgi:hypothetical protein
MNRHKFFFTLSLVGCDGKIHASAALPQGKEPQVEILWEAMGAEKPVWTIWRSEILDAI